MKKKYLPNLPLLTQGMKVVLKEIEKLNVQFKKKRGEGRKKKSNKVNKKVISTTCKESITPT